jgi:hypothetical protein
MKLNNIAGFESFAFLHLPPTEKMREAFEFYTDIVTSQDGSESRSIGRTIARHTLSYGVDANLFNRQFPFNLGEQNIRGNWAVPMWSDVQTLTPLTATVNLPVDPYLSDFRAGSLALAFVNNDDWQIRKIASVPAIGSFTITGGTISVPWGLQELFPTGVTFFPDYSFGRTIKFSPDGTRMILASGNYAISHTLTTPWNPATAVTDSLQTFQYSQNYVGQAWIPDGSKFFLLSQQSSTCILYQYIPVAPWTTGNANQNGSFQFPNLGSGFGIDFNADGTKLFVGQGNLIREYTLTTPYTALTPTANGVTLDLSSLGGISQEPTSFEFKSDGTKLFVVKGANPGTFFSLNLPTPWSLSGATADAYSRSFSFYEFGFTWKPDGTQFYLVTGDTGRIREFAPGGTIKNIEIDGLPVMGYTVSHTGNNSTTATQVAAAINSFVSDPDYSATTSGATVIISSIPDAAPIDGAPLVPINTGNLTVGSIANMSGVSAIGAKSITLESPFDARPYAHIVPVNAAQLRGDIDFEIGSFSSNFNFDANIIKPKIYPTRLAVLFACEVSSTVAGDSAKLTALKSDLTRALQDLRGAVVNSGVRLDLCLSFWGSIESVLTYFDATTANIDTAIAAVVSIGSLGGTDSYRAFTRAVTFFGTPFRNRNERKNIMFFSAATETNLDSSRTTAFNLITGLPPYDGCRAVDIYAIGMGISSTAQFIKVDNASEGIYSNVNSVTPFAMSDRFASALAQEIGYYFNGYEILTLHPNSNSQFSKAITQRQDIYDTELAPYVSRSPWNQSRIKSNHQFLFESGEESVAIRHFLYRRQGAARLFYMPTFQHDLPAYAISANRTQINVPNLDIRSFNADRVDVVIEFSDGIWQGNRIVSISADLFGGWLITFAHALRKGLAEVRQISYMGLSRFETDRIEMQWIGNRAVTMSINMVEIDK